MPTSLPIGKIAILVVAVIFLIILVTRRQPYLDYMPTAVEPCPSHYRCGATTRQQAAMENRLYADLRESSKYALPETVTTDQVDIVASDAEPTACMLTRAARAREGPKPEGVDDTWSAVDDGYERMRRAGPTPPVTGTLPVATTVTV